LEKLSQQGFFEVNIGPDGLKMRELAGETENLKKIENF